MILVVGSINMDVCLKVTEIPRPGETLLASSVMKCPGGKGANQAVAAAKLGADVIMLGCVGTDGHGTVLVDSLKSAGVDTSRIMRNSTVDSSTAYINIAKSGENAIVVDSSANMMVSPDYLKRNEDLFESADYCILQMEIPAKTVKAAVELCKKHQTKVVMNPSPLNGFDMALLQGVDYLVPNETEASELLGKDYYSANENDWNRFMQTYAIDKMIITLGGEGCKLFDHKATAVSFQSKKRNVVDTTGAGDTFLGAFVTAVAEGQNTDDAICFATIASGIEVTRFGAQKSMPTREEVENEL